MSNTMSCLRCGQRMKLQSVHTMINIETEETLREHKFTCVLCGKTEVFGK